MHIWVFFLHVCLCTIYMRGSQGNQKRASVPLALVVQMVVRLHVGAENQSQLLWENIYCYHFFSSSS